MLCKFSNFRLSCLKFCQREKNRLFHDTRSRQNHTSKTFPTLSWLRSFWQHNTVFGKKKRALCLFNKDKGCSSRFCSGGKAANSATKVLSGKFYAEYAVRFCQLAKCKMRVFSCQDQGLNFSLVMRQIVPLLEEGDKQSLRER